MSQFTPAQLALQTQPVPLTPLLQTPFSHVQVAAAGAVVGGIAVAAVYSGPARVAGEACAVPSHAAVADPILAGAGLVAAGAIAGGVTVVADRSSPASITEEACHYWSPQNCRLRSHRCRTGYSWRHRSESQLSQFTPAQPEEQEEHVPFPVTPELQTPFSHLKTWQAGEVVVRAFSIGLGEDGIVLVHGQTKTRVIIAS